MPDYHAITSVPDIQMTLTPSLGEVYLRTYCTALSIGLPDPDLAARKAYNDYRKAMGMQGATLPMAL